MITVPVTSGIPNTALNGRNPKYVGVNTVFLSECIREWYRQAYRSYLMRSVIKPGQKKGEPDDDGNQWKKLARKTIKIKKGMQKDGTYKEYLQGIKTPTAEKILALIEQIDYGKGDGINIRTGRLLATFGVPRIQNGRLLAGPDQVIKVKGRFVEIDFNIPYAKRITEGHGLDRPVFINGNEQQWMQKAVLKALALARIEFDRLEARYGQYSGGIRSANRPRP